MNYLKILSNKEKEEIEKKLNSQFGIKTIPGMIVQKGKERLFLLTTNFNAKEIRKIENTSFIERAGVYFAKIMRDKIRLSIEGTYLLKDQITKNIHELTKEESKQWMMGQELPIQTGKKDFLVIKYKEDFLGCGKASELKIGNFIPKQRRLKSKTIQ
jgi:NOL1/NOP2/fmu family ribosome biogenesis protein